jgi:hypothetical protein
LKNAYGIITRDYHDISGGSQGLGRVVTVNTARQLLALEDRAWTGIDAIFIDGKTTSALFYQDLEG